MKTIVISAFPGCGKSYFQKHTELFVLDSDSSKFSWIEKGVRNPDFPNNYIDHIQKNLNKVWMRPDIILVSSHKIVRDKLVENGIDFTLVYPDRKIKEEYIQRFINRGNDEGFINMLSKNWDNFLDEMESQGGCKKVTLKEGEYLSDVMNHIVKMNECHIIRFKDFIR